MEQKKKIRIAVIVLSVLLALSLLALGGTFIYRRLAAGGNTTVSIPDNLITPTGDIDTTGTTAPTQTGDGSGAAGTASATKSGTGTTAPARRAGAVSLPDAGRPPFPAGNFRVALDRRMLSGYNKINRFKTIDFKSGEEPPCRRNRSFSGKRSWPPRWIL